MNSISLLVRIGTDVVEFAFFCAVAFVILYTVAAPWWKTWIGRARIAMDASIAVALSPTMVHLWTGLQVENSLFFAWYTVGAVFTVGLVCLWNVLLLLHIQFAAARKLDSGTKEPPDVP